jgi:hypothetical protein
MVIYICFHCWICSVMHTKIFRTKFLLFFLKWTFFYFFKICTFKKFFKCCGQRTFTYCITFRILKRFATTSAINLLWLTWLSGLLFFLNFTLHKMFYKQIIKINNRWIKYNQEQSRCNRIAKICLSYHNFMYLLCTS